MIKPICVSRSQLLGVFAKYSVRQSPYHRPDNLEVVLDKLNDRLNISVFASAPLGIAKFSSWQELESVLDNACAGIHEFVAWNERKNGNDSPLKFTSRYDSDTNPDDDFIDLNALLRNVAVEIEHESNEL